MNRDKHKILVLTDLKETSRETLVYAIAVAKELNAALALLCVKKPNDIITTHNQLSAARNLNSEYIKAEQKAKQIIKSITNNTFFAVKSTIAFGNVKNEIEAYIESTNPDYIILGKKRKRILNLNSSNVTDFILKKFGNKCAIANKTNIAEIYEVLNRRNNKAKTA